MLPRQYRLENTRTMSRVAISQHAREIIAAFGALADAGEYGDGAAHPPRSAQ
jgi:hypothetical protein